MKLLSNCVLYLPNIEKYRNIVKYINIENYFIVYPSLILVYCIILLENHPHVLNSVFQELNFLIIEPSFF